MLERFLDAAQRPKEQFAGLAGPEAKNYQQSGITAIAKVWLSKRKNLMPRRCHFIVSPELRRLEKRPRLHGMTKDALSRHPHINSLCCDNNYKFYKFKSW
jgi:hypothetical protein